MSRRTNRQWLIVIMMSHVLCFLSVGGGLALDDPLNAQVRFVLPPHVEKVAEALTFFLDPYDYEVITRPPASPQAKQGLREALPLPLPHDQVMTVKEALLSVTPEPWAIVIDHPNKLVSLESVVDRRD